MSSNLYSIGLSGLMSSNARINTLELINSDVKNTFRVVVQ